jgi:hypothetical protein
VADITQFALDLAARAAPPERSLPERLHRLGLPRTTRIVVTHNRTVLLSWHVSTGLRLHAGYAAAPDAVLYAIVRFLARGVPRTERLAARRRFMAFPVDRHAPSRPRRERRDAVSPADQPVIDRLLAAHREFNDRHFGGALGPVAIRISDRMRSRLGDFTPAVRDGRARIGLSRRHIRRDGWAAVLDTLLHEMVHQWQSERGYRLDHGREFRRKARDVGIKPGAVVDLTNP